MNWFKRKKKNINTPSTQKKELPDGMWYKTPGGSIIHIRELKNNSYVCPEDDYHVRIGSKEYFEILFDNKSFEELDKDLSSSDPLKFVDTKSYKGRVDKSQKDTGLKDAIKTGVGKINNYDIVISCMDFSFIGGSMGSVVGEKISKAIPGEPLCSYEVTQAVQEYLDGADESIFISLISLTITATFLPSRLFNI